MTSWTSASRTTPSVLRLLIAGLVLGSLAWGAVAAWTVHQHQSAARDVVTAAEPLGVHAQRMYQSLSDADVTATTAFLSGPDQPLATRQHYQADIASAAAELSALEGAGQPLGSSLATVSAGLPVYTSYVAEAQTDSSLGFQLTGGSFMQVASEEMHLALLPAARSIEEQADAALAADAARATGLPWVVAAVLLAIVIGIVLLQLQRWLTRRTHRIFNVGLVIASVALMVGTGWLVVASVSARSDLQFGDANGFVPAQSLSRASIAVQQARGDEILNLISRSGDASFKQDFDAVRSELGPGPGTLLTSGAAASQLGRGAEPATAAVADARSWYAVNDKVYRLDFAANYADETRLVIGTGAGSSARGFQRLERDLGHAVAAGQATFRFGARAGAHALYGLEDGVVVAALLMAAGCAGGLYRRLAEYR
ncbi:MAG: hypothetical protein ABJB47_04075 [Actinomycetota bacterium]